MEKCKDRFKKFAVSLRSKMRLKRKKKDEDGSTSSNILGIQQCRETAKDPGIVGYDEDFTLDDLSVKSWNSCVDQSETQNNRVKIKDEALLKSPGIKTITRHSWDSPTSYLRTVKEDDTDVKGAECKELVTSSQKERESGFSASKPFKKEKSESDLKKAKSCAERIIIAGENKSVPIETNATNSSLISNELIQKFQGKSKEELILIVCQLQSDLDYKKKKLKELEDVLVRVIGTTSKLLQNPIFNAN